MLECIHLSVLDDFKSGSTSVRTIVTKDIGLPSKITIWQDGQGGSSQEWRLNSLMIMCLDQRWPVYTARIGFDRWMFANDKVTQDIHWKTNPADPVGKK